MQTIRQRMTAESYVIREIQILFSLPREYTNNVAIPLNIIRLRNGPQPRAVATSTSVYL